MSKPLKVLFIEDSDDDTLLLLRELTRSGYAPVFERVASKKEMETALQTHKWDLIVSDYLMPGFSGLKALAVFHKSGLDVPFIVVSGKMGEETAVKIMKAGAHDYIVKDNLTRFIPAVERELRDAETRRKRKKAEEDLKESEEKISVIATTATDAIVMTDDKGRISFWNPAAEKIFGFSEAESLGKPLHSFIMPKHFHASFKKGFNRFIRTGHVPVMGKTVEFLALRKDGTEFPVEVSLSAIQIKHKWHAVGIIRNITDRKLAEEELRRHRDNLEELVEKRTASLKITNEQLQREITDRSIAEEALWKAITKVEEEKAKSDAIIAAMGDGIVIIDTDFRIRYQNQIHISLVGEHLDEFCHEAYCREEVVCDECPVKMSFVDGKIHTLEKRILTDKGPLDLEITASPLQDASGAIIAGIEVVRDVSVRKRMEDELREHRDHLDLIVRERTAELRRVNKDLRSEIMRRIQMEKDLIESQRFVHQIADATPTLLYLFDVIELKVVYINTMVGDLLGYTPEDVKKMGGDAIRSLMHPEDLVRVEPRLQRFLHAREGDVIESEFRVRNTTGEWRWFFSRNVVFKKTSDGMLKLVLGIAQDITKRKMAERELEASREQLRLLVAHQHSVREEERARISREIHDELGQAMTALKMDISWLIKRLNPEQKPLYEKALLMAKLIDMNIQTVKRISAELRPGLLDHLGLTAALEWQAEEFQERTGITCKLSIAPEDIYLETDLSTAVFRIFQETLTNIVRHARAKKVTVKLKKTLKEVMLCVKDDGRGITREQTSSPKAIGLMGIRERVHFLGGRVNIDGIVNKGTTVTVHIPLSTGKPASRRSRNG